ncbi:MAG: rhodanese-like domain-containing protein [Gammaproteobacteria bacterium]|nr:rhodanese-like domain-containing protein [Gammaproteobacteria bacterium]MDH5731023.1 rhodanese-like domain-containing protein [Gammaproteobacteria bacterium]
MRLRWFILLLCLFTNGGVFAENNKPIIKKPLPEKVSGVTTLSALQLATMLANKTNLVLIDARIQKGRNKGFIHHSIHLPDIDTNCATLAKLIPNKTSDVVFYCSSSECGRSMNSVKKARECQYKNLYWFRGGFQEWKKNGYPYSK